MGDGREEKVVVFPERRTVYFILDFHEISFETLVNFRPLIGAGVRQDFGLLTRFGMYSTVLFEWSHTYRFGPLGFDVSPEWFL